MNSVTDSFTIDDGYNKVGTFRKIHVEGGTVVEEKIYDAQPHLEYAARLREATEGQRWGDGKIVGHIPPAEYARFLLMKDPQEKQKAIRAWLKENTKCVTFDRYLK